MQHSLGIQQAWGAHRRAPVCTHVQSDCFRAQLPRRSRGPTTTLGSGPIHCMRPIQPLQGLHSPPCTMPAQLPTQLGASHQHKPSLSHIRHPGLGQPPQQLRHHHRAVAAASNASSSSAAVQEEPQASPSAPQPWLLQQQLTWFDQLTETQRYVLADEWGFTMVGRNLPAGVLQPVILQALPEEVVQVDMNQALLGLVAPLALMLTGYSWLVYMHTITPLWQQLLCWVAIGTGYAGLFQLGHECARGTYLPDYPGTQELLGTLIMAPSLFSFATWRVRMFNHLNTVNELGVDTTAWHPLTLQELQQAGPLKRALLKLVATTPLKLLASIGAWAHSLQSWDLTSYYHKLRGGVLQGWAAPAVWASVCLPALMLATGGLSGLFTYWVGPWLVFHLWLSTLTLLHHTAPHIEWNAEPIYDKTRAIVSGTVTVPLPGWLERILSYSNYDLPQHILFDGVPFYHAKAATQAVRQKLWPYMNEAPLSIKLIVNQITKWQVYDENEKQYITYEEAEARLNEGGNSSSSSAAPPAEPTAA